MSFDAKVFKILVSSPSDVLEERKIISEEIELWNKLHSEKEGIVLLPVLWEIQSSAQLGDEPQEILNHTIVDDCDALIGSFWTRIGTKTKNAESGTVEEIQRLNSAEKLIMLYFSDVKAQLSDVDLEQYQKVKELKKIYYKRGIVKTYNNYEEFRKILNQDLILNVRQFFIGKSSTPEKENTTDSSLSEFALIDSFPRDNEPIDFEDIKKIFLRFNKPIDYNSTMYIGNYHVKSNSFCQWNICGWIQMDEDDSKLIWHVKEELLTDSDNYGSQEMDYHTFEIHIGREPNDWRIKSKDGQLFPFTKVRVKIRKR